MFGWKSKEEQKQELLNEVHEQIRAEQEARDNAEVAKKKAIEDAAEQAREQERARIKAEEAARNDEAAKMKDSAEPWVVIKAMVPDPEKGIRVELDWNDAFVKHLRKYGYTGADDDTVIQRYVAVLSKQVADDMADSQLNENE